MSPPRDPLLHSLLREIHRRSLWQILGFYVAAAWVALQVVVTIDEVVELPDWIPIATLVFLAVGLPVVLATGFVQEGGPLREGQDEDDDTLHERLLTWRNALIVGGTGLFALIAASVITVALSQPDVGDDTVAAALPIATAGIGPSIAVLPFEDLGGEPAQEYFSDGLAEEILNALSQVEELQVIARTSSFAFRDAGDVRAIADSLGVTNILEGSVRRLGERVRISVRLIEAETGLQLWSGAYENDLSDVFAVQDTIARTVADRLEIRLSSSSSRSLATGGTESASAYEAYLRGRSLLGQRTTQSLMAAHEEFEAATALDPGYAEAFSGLADSYALVDRYALQDGVPIDLRATHALALEAAQRAVDLAPSLGMAQASLAFAHMKMGQWSAAEVAFERAVDLSPGYAPAHQWYGLFLGITGRPEEGVEHASRAVELDPVSPVVRITLAAVQSFARRHEEVVAQARIASSMDRDWWVAHAYMGVALVQLGRYDEAMEAMTSAVTLRGTSDPVGAEATLEALVEHHRTGEPQTITWPDARLDHMALVGDRDRALVLFGQLVGAGGYELAADYHMGPTGDLLRGDPEYEAILAEADITW